MFERLIPADLLPRVGDLGADHRRRDAIGMRRIAIGKATLDAGVAAIGLALAAGDHAHDLLVLDLGLERATHAAIGAGGGDSLLRAAHQRQTLFAQSCRGAGLNAGTARDALGIHERFVLAGRYLGIEAAAGDGQRKRALYFIAGAHAARAGDAQRRVEIEVRVAAIAGRVLMVGAIEAIGAAGHTQIGGDALQLAMRIGRAAFAIERMVGHIQFNHALAQLLQLVALGTHFHARSHQRGAGSRIAALALNFDQTHAAGAEGLERVGGAQLGDGTTGSGCGTHDRRACRHGDLSAVDGQCDRRAVGGRCAVVFSVDREHGSTPVASALAREIIREMFDSAHDREMGHATEAAQ